MTSRLMHPNEKVKSTSIINGGDTRLLKPVSGSSWKVSVFHSQRQGL